MLSASICLAFATSCPFSSGDSSRQGDGKCKSLIWTTMSRVTRSGQSQKMASHSRQVFTAHLSCTGHLLVKSSMSS